MIPIKGATIGKLRLYGGVIALLITPRPNLFGALDSNIPVIIMARRNVTDEMRAHLLKLG
ncbi:hypothetical protein BXT84_00175 [Sulfobacillus thermotolerans]|uniref:Uncharacterized protein n=1 Tax=Sulfobacillus thermotolerans TaxID=338644 RepID=A0ABN5GWQ7_9FIRM|nr:hypothetical protein BXT84_00175 [Sulfobacillus thermotolerans]